MRKKSEGQNRFQQPLCSQWIFLSWLTFMRNSPSFQLHYPLYMKRKKEKDTKPSSSSNAGCTGNPCASWGCSPKVDQLCGERPPAWSETPATLQIAGSQIPREKKKKQLRIPFRKKKDHEERSLEKMLKHEVPFWRKSSRSSLCRKGQKYSHSGILHSTNSCWKSW